MTTMALKLKLLTMLLLTFPIPLTLVNNGDKTAVHFGKLEINQTAVLAGPSVLLSQLLIDTAFIKDKTSDSQLKIWFHAAQVAVTDATVDILWLL